MFSGESALELLKKIAFPRLGGSEGERKAAEILRKHFSNLGYEVSVEEFDLWTYRIIEARLDVLGGKGVSVECSGVGLSADTPSDGVEGELVYVEECGSRFMEKARGKIWLYYGKLTAENYRRALRYSPKAIILVGRNPRKLPLKISILSEWWEHGRVPIVAVKYEDALKLYSKIPVDVRVTLRQEVFKSKSRNIIAVKKGKTYPDETIIVGGHYDSVFNVVGAHDNAGGIAVVGELARVFSEAGVKRTLKLVAFGSEEMGLVGSRRFVKEYSEELKSTKLFVNIDVCGQPLGTLSAIVSGGEDIKNAIEVLSSELGIHVDVSQDIYSSDSSTLAAKGVPSVSFARFGGSSYFIHTIEDSLEYISKEGLEYCGVIAEEFLKKTLIPDKYPFSTEIPDNIKKKLKEYFDKKLGVKIE